MTEITTATVDVRILELIFTTPVKWTTSDRYCHFQWAASPERREMKNYFIMRMLSWNVFEIALSLKCKHI
jgi:hypothetical protein